MVKRAVAKVVGTAPFELHKTADDIQDINARKDLLYSIGTDQEGKYKEGERRIETGKTNDGKEYCLL